jgi:hypothetical protein
MPAVFFWSPRNQSSACEILLPWTAVFLKLRAPISGTEGMRTRKNNQTLTCLAALITFGLSLSVWADETHWPLRLRGSGDLQTEYNDGNLIVSFQPGSGPANSGLQPGEASWLDRGFRPTEPHQLQQAISEDEATQLVTYLSNPDNYVTFYTASGGDGYFGVFSSEPYAQGQQTPSEPRRFTWNSSVNAGRLNAGGEGRTVVIEGGDNSGGTAVIGGGPRVFEHGHWVPKSEHHGEGHGEGHGQVAERHLEKEQRHGENKTRETGARQHVALQKVHGSEHLVRGGGHQVSLVKPINRPLVRPAVAKVNHPAVHNPPKKKK